MNAYLVFSLKSAIEIVEEKYKLNKNSIFITDKITVYNILKKNKYKTILAQNFLSQEKFNEIFKLKYEFFIKKLKELDKKSTAKINYFYNMYGQFGSREFVGVNCILFSLKKIIKKYKIKKFFFLNNMHGAILNDEVYSTMFKLFSQKNKILYENIGNGAQKKEKKLIKIILKLKQIINKYREFNIKKIFPYLKIKISKIIFLKKKNGILILEPACDLTHMQFSIRKTFFINFETLTKIKNIKINKTTILKEDKINCNDEYLKIILEFIKNETDKNKHFIEHKINIIINFIKTHKIKKVFWGVSPSPELTSLIDKLRAKKIKVYGTQHGGKYFILQDDIHHKDMDYAYCDYYLSYCVSKRSNKKKYFDSKKKTLLDIGCFRSEYISEKFKTINQKNYLNNLLFVPITSSFLLRPRWGSMDIKLYNTQSLICRSLNKNNSYINYVKILDKAIFRSTIFDTSSLEHNPITYDIKNYKNLKVKSCSLIKSINDLRPKIIICGSLSTPIYEIIKSKSEIILFLDSNNLPKKDVYTLLQKRIFIVKNIREMNLAINQIKKKEITKVNNNEFIEKFYLLKRKQVEHFKQKIC